MIPQLAILLAAGRGSRLSPLTDTIPKCLLPVLHSTFLGLAIDSFQKIGIKKFKIVVGYRAKQIIDYLQDNYTHLEFQFVHNPDFENTNTAYSLGLALKKPLEPFFLQDADLYYDPTLLEDVINVLPKGSLMVIDDDIKKLNAEGMKVRFNQKHHLLELSKEITLDQAHGEFIGLSYFDQSWTLALANELKNNIHPLRISSVYYEDIISDIVSHQSPIHAFKIGHSLWHEVDTLEDYHELNKMLQNSPLFCQTSTS